MSLSPTAAAPSAGALSAVVFIAGANWSGSTMTGAVLGANATSPFEYFHIGEAHVLFRPDAEKFGDPGFAKQVTDFWQRLDYGVGPENAYTEIERASHSTVLIDSSKTIAWFEMQRGVCEKLGVPIIPVVTFRSFRAIFKSALSRGKGTAAGFQNLRYYKRLINSGLLGDNWISVDTEALVKDPAGITRALCAATGVPYFAGKESYWNYPLLHISGARTQRQHSTQPGSGSYNPEQVKGKALSERLTRRLDRLGFLDLERKVRRRAISSVSAEQPPSEVSGSFSP